MKLEPVFLLAPDRLPVEPPNPSRRAFLLACSGSLALGLIAGAVSVSSWSAAHGAPEDERGEWVGWAREMARASDEEILGKWEAILQIAHLHAFEEPLLWDLVARLVALTLDREMIGDSGTRARVARRLDELLAANHAPAHLLRHQERLRALAR